jgi:hypothetical protein
MTPNQAFDILNLIALVAWVLLMLSPRLPRWTSTVTGAVVPAVFATVYAAVVVATWAGSDGGFSSLADVATLFGNPWILLAGWTHYLAFDLLVGNWEIHDARRRGIPYVLVLPCLVLTFLFGPAGWLLYGILRKTRGTEPVAKPAV